MRTLTPLALAQAQTQPTVPDCLALIEVVQEDLLVIFDGATDTKPYTSLSSKLDEASDKLIEGKPVDAVQKLVDFQTTVMALSTAPKLKLSLEEAALLLNDSQAAINCIEALGP